MNPKSKKMSSLHSAPLCVFALLLASIYLGAGAYGDTIIIDDTLQRNANTPDSPPNSDIPLNLQGTSPDTQNTTPSSSYQTGVYQPFTTTVASGATNGPTNGVNAAELPVLGPFANFAIPGIYTLTVTEAGGTYQSGSYLLGFDDYNPGTPPYYGIPYYDVTGPTVILAGGDSATANYGNANPSTHAFANGDFNNNFDGTPETPENFTGGPNHLKLVLNTTGLDWTVTAYVNGHELVGDMSVPGVTGNTYTYLSGNPTINAIAFGGGGDYTDLELTYAVPEPATFSYLLIGAGLIGICLRRRSLRKV